MALPDLPTVAQITADQGLADSAGHALRMQILLEGATAAYLKRELSLADAKAAITSATASVDSAKTFVATVLANAIDPSAIAAHAQQLKDATDSLSAVIAKHAMT